MSKPKVTYEKFLELRAVTVKAIALTWSSEKLKAEYKENPIAFMREYLNYKFPFHMNFMIEEAEAAENQRRWRPAKTGGWVGPNNTLEMILPPKPIDESQQAIALSYFNASHLTMFDGGSENQ